MAWYNDGPHTRKRFRLGTIKKDIDGREFIYLQGVGSLAANEWVAYDEAFVTSRLSTSSTPGPVAIAQVAADATTEYGWFGISGSFTGVCVDGGGNDDNEEVYATGTAGAVTAAADNDEKIMGAVYRSNDNSTTLVATFQIALPFKQHDLSA